MSAFRTARNGAAALAAAALLAYLAFHLPDFIDADYRHLPEYLGRIGSEHDRTRKLKREIDEVWGRRNQRVEVLQAVAAGRLTLVEAAVRFRRIDRSLPGFAWDHFHLAYPCVPDEEAHCLEVIAWVSTVFDGEPTRAREVKQRLEAELDSLRRQGPVRLPD